MHTSHIDPHVYHQLEIHIHAYDAEREAYPVVLHVPGEKDFPPGWLALDKEGVGALAARPDFGQALGERLFAAEVVGDAYREALAVFQKAGWKARLRLRLDAPELHPWRWERLRHPLAGEWLPLAATTDTLFSRYMPKLYWERALPLVQRPARVLVIFASPLNADRCGLASLGEGERSAWHTLFDELPDDLADVDYLDRQTTQLPTLANLRENLREKSYHIVHFVGHGRKGRRQSALVMEDDVGNAKLVPANHIVEAFHSGRHPPHLAFLAACESGKQTAQSEFVALGPTLVTAACIPAVLAMAEQVGIHAAREFAATFYRRLFTHGLVDLATHEARAALRGGIDWSVPVLFSHLPDNLLLADPTALEALAGEIRQRYHLVGQDELLENKADDPATQMHARESRAYQWVRIRASLREYEALNEGQLPPDLAAIAGHARRAEAQPEELVLPDEMPVKHRGLIVQVGIGRPQEGRVWEPYTDAAWSAIVYHIGEGDPPVLEHCWLLASRKSYPNAQRLAELCEARGVRAHVHVVKDAFNVDETYRLVRAIYVHEAEACGLAPTDVIADFTGAVRPMSVGIGLACGHRYPMQYMYGRKPGIASTPRRVELGKED